MRQSRVLYRYRSLTGSGFRYTQDIFLRRRLYLPERWELNDPTEGAYRLKPRVLEEAGLSYHTYSPLRAANDDARILSFSESERNALMWSHYADQHRGICIGFKRSALEGIADLRQVRYRSRVPVLSAETVDEAKSEAGFLSKSTHWKYESEWRIINFEGKKYLDLPSDAISVVVLGVRTSQEDREWLFEWLRLSGCSAVVKFVEFSGHAAKMHVLPFRQ